MVKIIKKTSICKKIPTFDECQTAIAPTWPSWLDHFSTDRQGTNLGGVWAIIFNDSRAKFLSRPAMFGRHQSRGAKCTNHQQSSGSVCWSWCPDLKGSCRGENKPHQGGRCLNRHGQSLFNQKISPVNCGMLQCVFWPNLRWINLGLTKTSTFPELLCLG